MPACTSGHTIDSDIKFCPICGSPAASTDSVTPPPSGFRSTMKRPSTPSYGTNAGRDFSSSTGYSAPAPTAPTYAPPAYAAPVYGAPTYTGPAYVAPVSMSADPRPSAKGLGIAGMVLGIVSLVLFFAWFIGIICSIVGLVLSSVAWRKIASGNARPDGKGFAIAGFVTSIISVAFFILLIFVFTGIFYSNNY